VLNIKDPEAHRLAKELAEREGVSMTHAVTQALREALNEHARRRTFRRQILEGLVASARSAGDALGGDPTDDLYDDETGLPE
jgi:antitoxin VapB